MTHQICLRWFRCKSRTEQGFWCSLEKLDLSTVTEEGVYVIWYGEDVESCVYVGQGNVNVRLSKHLDDPEIIHYSKLGILRVTWASVTESQRDGVERFLADELTPLVGTHHPDVKPILANLPGE